jgi:hypothetical protein
MCAVGVAYKNLTLIVFIIFTTHASVCLPKRISNTSMVVFFAESKDEGRNQNELVS